MGALTFLPCSAQAQARGPSRNPSNVDAGTPIVAEGLSDFPVKAEISAGTEGKVASIKFNLNQVATVLAGNKATAQVDGNSFTLTVSTPWDGDTD
ncbi:MAG: hypothetical protein QFC78_11890, partial [Pseudomonadota bacterium]|nr:hypothetical protein [Pseudomonadota bacterium]